MTKGQKTEVNVTELRQNLPSYLAEVRKGREIEVKSRGRVIARIVAGGDPGQEARARLKAARKNCKLGDVLSPSGERWDASK